MIHSIKRLILLVALPLSGFFISREAYSQSSVWPEIKKETHPWIRWWWMGSAVNENDIAGSLNSYNKAGIGGVEIAPIYGVKGNESQDIQYLSLRWMSMLNYTVKAASGLNMGVDLTNGTGWPFGGPQITPPYAASKLIVQTYHLTSGSTLSEKIRVKEPKQEFAAFQFLTAYSDKGEVLQLDDKVGSDGTLNWSPKAGNWDLYAVFNGKTRQMVKRSSPGGEGYSLNHFSKEALAKYLDRFDQAFNNKPPGVRAFYNDSYEVYDADWSENFLSLFREKRGYDLRPFIKELISKEPSEHQARLKSDYRETMSEMLLENFTEPWTAWAHKYQGITRNQAHGSPGNLLDLYAAVDIPECETFGSSYFPVPGLRRDSADIRNVDPDPVMLKFASSAAHVAGHNLTSCETFTWLTEHFKTSLSQCKPEVEQVFLSGINHVFFHGTAYTPKEASWPGWLFYASVDFTPNNSFWNHLPGLTSYITRVQSVLQTGKPDNEILIYWPVYDAWNNAKGMDMPLKVHNIDDWLHPSSFYKNVIQLQKKGYCLDFISDNLLKKASSVDGKVLTSAAGAPYKVLIIPKAEIMPLETLKKALQLAESGASVIIQQLPADIPGLGNLDNRREQFKELLRSLSFSDAGDDIKVMNRGSGRIILSGDVQKALVYTGLYPEKLTEAGLQFIRRQDGTDKYYYLVNHTSEAVNREIPLNVKAGSVLIMDPQTGASGAAAFSEAEDVTKVKVQMLPGEALILKASPVASPNVKAWLYLNKALNPIEVKGKWNLHFTDGGPSLPADRQLKQPEAWTSFSDSAATAFSGRAEYSISFSMPKVSAFEFVLDAGKVYESARIWVNGNDAGILWSIPYRTRIGRYLKPGKNTIKIEVANLMANRIRYMDRKGIEWKKFKDINIVDINYKPLDASSWKVMPSGLDGPVRIIPYKD